MVLALRREIDILGRIVNRKFNEVTIVRITMQYEVYERLVRRGLSGAPRSFRGLRDLGGGGAPHRSLDEFAKKGR
jgi:hypothetical protein